MNSLLDLNPDRMAELNRMKMLALALLGAVTVTYIISAFFEHNATWVGYINAAAEAAMVGAIADWFAVTALFRHPLGIPIPHTAIIPKKKDDFADQFGEFVQTNFLSQEVIGEKIRSMHLSRRVATWLVEEENAEAVAEQITAGLAGAVRVMNDTDVQTLIEQKVEEKIRTTSFAPIIGDLLSFITSGKRQQDLFDNAVGIGLYFLEDSDRDIRDKVAEETPWWFPSSVDKAIYQRIVRSVSKMLYEMQVDIYHPFRVRIMTVVNEFMNDLKNSDDIRAKEIAIKEDMLQTPAVVDFTSSLWRDIKDALVRQSEHTDTDLHNAIRKAVLAFGESILEDEELEKKIDGWAEDTARYLIDTYGHEVADLISDTIESWDPVATSERVEEQIGKDLQFIRINGTLVGGLVGLTIHGVRDLIERLV